MKDTGRDIYPKGLELLIRSGDVDDLTLRFHLQRQLMRMKYGEMVLIPHEVVVHAWKPTGDYDRSFEGAFRALALSAGGHRPEESLTTEERIRRDLDGSFRFERRYWEADRRWLFERMKSHCPHCHGEGYLDIYEPSEPPPLFDPYAEIDVMTVTISKKRITCEHAP